MMMEEMITPIMLMVMVYLISKMHIINSLIIIEYISIMVIILMMIFVKSMTLENHNVLYFMILLITESVLGLSILVSMIRTHGNDFLKSSTVLKL
ncbi:NADH dehydrogenase subunit 4L (mitochondrion) [Bemisia tabaci]|uniref:NADH dehydrogenase subunit 4L n=1 Tax=Bemisia tabaci TaxID=7038 RepID=Q674Q5_BEMTA|nr:NADH dehydrogenase subunit 4L [Bemisia tabaci]AAU14199.1 NADH dehydrogenase subunit 4L [Bemisia tabaci]